MKTTLLTQLILDSKSLFSEDWLATNGLFFHQKHIQRFSNQVLYFHEHGVSNSLPLPHFSEEVTPKPSDSFSFFKATISELERLDFSCNSSNKNRIVDTIQNTPFEHILLIMGQRQTPATLKTAEGLPLKNKALIDSCLKPFNNQICVGVRAWEKHTDRSEDNFWGAIKGTPQQKQQNVEQIINSIIDNHTWWNTFHHYKHDIVFEIRVESGHGMRWSYHDQSLIGFLEPFL